MHDDVDTIPEGSDSSPGDTDDEIADESRNESLPSSKRPLPPPKLTRLAKKTAMARGSAMVASSAKQPDSYHDIQKCMDREQWEQACDAEINALQELKVFDVVNRPAGVKPLTSKWVFELKKDPQGNVTRYRARLVVRGHKQRAGIDYTEVFAPVAKAETIRVLLAYAAALDLEIEQIDVKTAFLYGNIEEDLYMEPPEGYDFGGGKVWELQKSLYGLKQAARAWHSTLREKLISAGFTVSTADASLFVCTKGSATSYLLIYVDDGLIVGKRDDVNTAVEVLEQHFKLRKMGGVSHFLGSEVLRDRSKKTIIVTQRKYAREIVAAAGQKDANPRTIPLEVNVKLSKEGDDKLEDPSKYAEITGMLMYLSNGTRPDLSYSVGVLARFMACPRREHWQRLIGVVRYLKGTINKGLIYDGSKLGEIVGFSDSDFGGDPDKRRSTTGYVFTLAGGAVSWSSKLQPAVAASTTEAEYMAAAHSTKEALWLKKVIKSFRQSKGDQALKMFGDNQAALCIMQNPTSHQRTKHIDVQHHFVRDRVQRGEVQFMHVNSKDNCADMLTKAVCKPQLESIRAQIGLVDLG